MLSLGFRLTGLQAQEALPTAGGEAIGSGGTASYTVGQVGYTTHTGTTGSVAESVQQPYEISMTTGLEGSQGIDLFISVYPNPATDHLILNIYEFEISDLSFQLYDMHGALLINEIITDNETGINVSNLESAIYFVTVTQNSKEVKTFKIIKN
jgi:hypothetical protein